MPIYEFHCEKCGADSEILVRSARDSGAKCPHCGSAKLEKKWSTFAAAGARKSSGGAAAAGGGHQCCGGCCHAH